ncbi:uncharacterized protein A4U43_C03F18430 [Asparagus officinalis]|uniref:Glycosyltransferase n=1 Tax=Asparagus officinalis TaxID=4686 RepID=A0A5P1FCY4_ASPOF|nr:UDP-glycosyltransferase 85A2-like [Asparagus officinalis]ONK75583.1 uncharacterized protein A4U43_C03F18430 [Asparagus officinalis]
MGSITIEKPHAVLVPYPAQGHINPMLRLGKLLHAKGFHVTFVNTEYNHRRLVRSWGPGVVKGVDGFRFETIPDGLPPSDVEATQDIPALCDSTTRNCLEPFRQLLRKLNSNSPPVSCIVSDGVMSFTLDAAEELGVPEVLFWTTSACGFMAYLHYHELVARGLAPLRDMADVTNGYLDTPVDCIPRMNKLRLKDFPSFIRTTDPDDVMLRFVVRETSRAARATAILLNTFDELERPVLEEMASIVPPVYTIGPLFLLANQLPANSPVRSLTSSLWKQDTTCTGWLDSKRPGSIVYVNFGSITVMSTEQLVEFAWGLAKSGYDFLWVIRPDLVKGEDAVLPRDFLVETNGRSLLVNWCDQEAVLSHPAIGGFLTHSGWNSTLESICAGVPMICWPFFAEQQTNCRYVCAEWDIGMEIDGDVKRKEVEGLIRELMGGEKGKELRRRVMELKEKGVKAAEKDGSSSVNFERMIKEVLLANNI